MEKWAKNEILSLCPEVTKLYPESNYYLIEKFCSDPINVEFVDIDNYWTMANSKIQSRNPIEKGTQLGPAGVPLGPGVFPWG